jgi:tetratricopeptide (TPR) repeat protein
MGALNMSERKARVLSAGAALAVLMHFLPAQAQPGSGNPTEVRKDAENEARQSFREGDRLYAEGDYEGAVKAFEKAHALSGREALKYNMANAYERLGRYEAALSALRDYLPHTRPEEQDIVRRRIEKLEKRVEEQRLKAQQAELGNDGSPPVVAATPGGPAAADVPPSADPASTPVLGYVMLGVGALGLGVGTYFGLQALGDKSDAEASCVEAGSQRRCPARAQDSLDETKQKALIADISLGAGLLAGALGAYLVLSHGPKKAASSRMLRVGAGKRGTHLTLIGTF